MDILLGPIYTNVKVLQYSKVRKVALLSLIALGICSWRLLSPNSSIEGMSHAEINTCSSSTVILGCE